MSSVEELFVWPAFRHDGLGALLEKAVIDLAKQRGSARVRILRFEADSWPVADRADGMRCISRGYHWTPMTTTRPWLSGCAERTLEP